MNSAATDEMVEACVRLYEEVLKNGNPELIKLARLLLYQIGWQIAGEIRAANDDNGRPPRR